jgi:signal peptidase II
MNAALLAGPAAAGAGFLFLDQWTKKLVQGRTALECLSWGHVLRVRRVAHTSAAYQRGGFRIALVLIWLAALASSILLHGTGVWFQGQAALCGLAVALAGAAGNLLDILRRHYIVNFIDLGWWPVFNLADAGIILGLALALVSRT